MSEEDQLGPSQEGSVVLDIGGDIGALVLHTSVELLGAEIEISPADGQGADVFQANGGAEGTGPVQTHTHDGHTHSHAPGRTHVAVRERRGPNGVQYAAIYPGLREGEYTLFGTDGSAVDTVRVIGGQVVELDWR